jgi:hypothetical protein
MSLFNSSSASFKASSSFRDAELGLAIVAMISQIAVAPPGFDVVGLVIAKVNLQFAVLTFARRASGA